MSDGLRLNNLLSSGWKYLTSSDIRISILYNIKISQVRVPRPITSEVGRLSNLLFDVLVLRYPYVIVSSLAFSQLWRRIVCELSFSQPKPLVLMGCKWSFE
jgi:hypothetical protein